ncbi:Pre-mRNA-processing factor 19 [Ascosphaera atra]|nr:Pre-mRNA-processing factor 19 [Ascosphaera atra]
MPLLTLPVLNVVKFHPDGHLVACGGADTQIKIFDIKTGTCAATFPCAAPLKALVFSENGIWLASLTQSSTSVSIWDLRKSAEVKVLDTGSEVESLCWDYTGQFLCTGGKSGVTVQRYAKANKEWSEPLRSAVPAVSVAWGEKAQSLFVLDKDGRVSVLGAEAS